MQTDRPPLVLSVDAQHPDASIIARAAAILDQGGLVAFPTETVYGLGAHALNANAVARIFEAKGRPAWNPVIAHVASAAHARELVTDWPAAAEKLSNEFWPGPLTLVLPKRWNVPGIATAGLQAVGIRVPSHPVALALINALNGPIAAPSANRFTELSPTTAAHVAAGLGNRVEMILDGGSCSVGIESTVVDLTGVTPTILRPGTIGRDALIAALGGDVMEAARETETGNTPRLSPGRTERHYAPRAEVWLFDAVDAGSFANAAADFGSRNLHTKVATLVLDWSLALPPNVRAVRMPTDPLAYARTLYATLHELDAADFGVIAIERPPRTSAWAGVHDRLNRAAHS